MGTGTKTNRSESCMIGVEKLRSRRWRMVAGWDHSRHADKGRATLGSDIRKRRGSDNGGDLAWRKSNHYMDHVMWKSVGNFKHSQVFWLSTNLVVKRWASLNLSWKIPSLHPLGRMSKIGDLATLKTRWGPIWSLVSAHPKVWNTLVGIPAGYQTTVSLLPLHLGQVWLLWPQLGTHIFYPTIPRNEALIAVEQGNSCKVPPAQPRQCCTRSVGPGMSPLGASHFHPFPISSLNVV